jgi:hypothetical protein
MAATKRSRCLKEEEEFVHPIELVWTGRGKPKKFCPPCKIFVSSVEHVDFCHVPTNVNSGIE